MAMRHSPNDEAGFTIVYSNYWWVTDQFLGRSVLRTIILVWGVFVENMKFECDVLVWHVLAECGLT